jgi:hypothetical protein
VVTKSGSFFSYGDERLGQGRNNAKLYLEEHPEVAKEIEERNYKALGVNDSLVVPIDGDLVIGEDDTPIDFEAEAAAIKIADERAA